MENKASFQTEDIINNAPLHVLTENTEFLKENFKYYDECKKIGSLENLNLENGDKFEPPDEFLVNKIIQQVEFLFSDANILKDKFLLKHIRRNKEGYVSLKLISSLRKVKALTKDWRVVAYSLEKSQKLEMNKEKTKIKRISPLPQENMLDASRTVLVFHYQPKHWSMESLKKQLNMLGSIMFLETVNSKIDFWYVNVKKTLEFYEKIATLPFAVVMFETPDEAANAVLQTSHPSSIYLKIVPVLEDEVFKCPYPIEEIPIPDFPNFPRFHDRISRFGERPYSEYSFFPGMQLSAFASGHYMIYPPVDKSIYKEKMASQRNVDEKPFLPCSYKGDGPINNEEPRRRICFRNPKQARVIILRHPKGPDGTKGFTQKQSTGIFFCTLH